MPHYYSDNRVRVSTRALWCPPSTYLEDYGMDGDLIWGWAVQLGEGDAGREDMQTRVYRAASRICTTANCIEDPVEEALSKLALSPVNSPVILLHRIKVLASTNITELFHELSFGWRAKGRRRDQGSFHFLLLRRGWLVRHLEKINSITKTNVYYCFITFA